MSRLNGFNATTKAELAFHTRCKTAFFLFFSFFLFSFSFSFVCNFVSAVSRHEILQAAFEQRHSSHAC